MVRRVDRVGMLFRNWHRDRVFRLQNEGVWRELVSQNLVTLSQMTRYTVLLVVNGVSSGFRQSDFYTNYLKGIRFLINKKSSEVYLGWISMSGHLLLRSLSLRFSVCHYHSTEFTFFCSISAHFQSNLRTVLHVGM